MKAASNKRTVIEVCANKIKRVLNGDHFRMVHTSKVIAEATKKLEKEGLKVRATSGNYLETAVPV